MRDGKLNSDGYICCSSFSLMAWMYQLAKNVYKHTHGTRKYMTPHHLLDMCEARCLGLNLISDCLRTRQNKRFIRGILVADSFNGIQ